MNQRSYSNLLGLLAAIGVGGVSCSGGDEPGAGVPTTPIGAVTAAAVPGQQPVVPAANSPISEPALPVTGEPAPATNPAETPMEPGMTPVAPVAPPTLAVPPINPVAMPADDPALSPPAGPAETPGMPPVDPAEMPALPPPAVPAPEAPPVEVPPMVEPPPTAREGAPDGTGPFIEHEGLIIIEIESTAAVGPWRAQDDQAGFTGDSYYVATSDNGASLEYPIRIVNAGTYQLFAYGNQLGADWDAANDVFLTVPGANAVAGFADVSQGRHKWYIGSHRDHELPSHSGPDREERIRLRRGLTNEWRWWMYTEDPRQPVRVQFDAGVHEIQIHPRSSGFALDRVALVRWQDGDAVMPVDEAAEALVQAPPSYRDE